MKSTNVDMIKLGPLTSVKVDEVELWKRGDYKIVYYSGDEMYGRVFPDILQAVERLQIMANLIATNTGDRAYRVEQLYK